MKHLYRIEVEHAAPKDLISAIAGYVIAENEEKLYDYLASCNNRYEPKCLKISTGWKYNYKENSDNNELYEYYDEEDNIHTENWKERMIRLKGEIGDEERDYPDAHYGVTYYGWRDLGEVNESIIAVLELALKNDLVIIN